ncbi:MAG: FAD-dependent oxidoreductase, partial [Planctomycetota bacterium]
LREATIVLKGDGVGPVNDMTVLSEAASTYAPEGEALVCANAIGYRPHSGAEVREQMQAWFGESVKHWRLLRVYPIRHALPICADRSPGGARGIFVCGDHCVSPSLQGAMLSGRRAAEAILQCERSS